MVWFRNKKNSKKENGKPNKKSARFNPRLRFQKRIHTALDTAAHTQPEQSKTLVEVAQEETQTAKLWEPASVPTQPIPQYPSEFPRELPAHYGDNLIYLMVRDPYYLYSYWEIQSWHQEHALKQLGGDWAKVKSILRVYDATDETRLICLDIVLTGLANNWYVEVQPNRSFFVEIGLLHENGRFIALARSNRVMTPRAGMSDVIDEQWMGIDFDKMYALSGGFEVGKSSLELKKLMEERLMGAISSGSGAGLVSSITSPSKIKKRGFWFVLDCEVIVYGATEPNATVLFQGKPIQLRPDGTFTLRFAFPDGKQVFDAKAISADRLEERTITPVVERRTERPKPAILEEANWTI